MSETPIDPVCLFHGLKRSEHKYGRCLYCCLCFVTLEPEECWEDEEGVKWDICIPCGEMEQKMKEEHEPDEMGH